MQVGEVKTSATASPTIQAKRQPFFNKEGADSFFSKSSEPAMSFFSPTSIQPKLTIGRPNDKYEVEADAMADTVVQRLSSSSPTSDSPFDLQPTREARPRGLHHGGVLTKLGSSKVQTKCSDCEHEERLQKKEEPLLNDITSIQRKPIFESDAEQPEAEVQTKLSDYNYSPFEGGKGDVLQAKCTSCQEREKLQKKEGEELADSELTLQRKSADLPSENTSDLEGRLSSTKGSGTELPSDIQTSMGSEFGADFSNVRIHTGSQAVQMSQGIGAQAFTHGNDIYFNQGKYDTNSNTGKHLLVHELTHTVQQGNNKPNIQKTPITEFNQRYPGLIDDILGVSSSIDVYLEQFNYPNSSARSRTDAILHSGMSYNLATINGSYARVQSRFMLIDEVLFNERMVNNVNEEITYNWLRHTLQFLHYLRGLAYAQYVYPLYRGSQTFRADIPIDLRNIVRSVNQIRSNEFILTHGAQEVMEVDAERERHAETIPETRTVSIEETISHTRAYIRSNLNGIMRQQHPLRWYARGMTNLLRQDLGTDSERYLEFFRTLRSESREILRLLAFEGQLSTNLISMGIRGLEDIVELRGSNAQFAYHMVLGSWNIDEETGEEQDAPGVALVFDVLVGLIPVLGQVVDVRDVTGYIYRLSKYDSQRDSWGTWIGLIGSLIGLVPAAGDAAKSLLSALRHGLSDMPVGRMSEAVVQGITRHVDRRYLDLLLDSSDDLARNLTVRWITVQGSVLNLWDSTLRAYRPYLVQLTDLTAAQITRLAAAAQEILPQRLQETGRLFGEVIQFISRNAAEEVRGIMREVRALSADGRLTNALEDFERMEREVLEAVERGGASEANEIVDNMRRMIDDESAPRIIGESEELRPPELETGARIPNNEGNSLDNASILEETRHIEDVPLSGSHLEAEIRAAQLRSPRPSTEPGYQFEIGLPNGHTWRLNSNGRWCRFTGEFCYTDESIPEHLRDILEDIAGRQSDNTILIRESTQLLRRRPGVAQGGSNLQVISGTWVENGVGLFPGQIARRMRGMHFENFRDFRETFWLMVSRDPVLSQDIVRFFNPADRLVELARMRRGLAPTADVTGRIGRGVNARYQLNHILALQRGGAVYDMDNIEIVSPRFHGLIDP